MKFFGWLRALGFLRRIARALEEANALKRKRMELEFEEYAREVKSKGRKTRKLDISHPTTEEWNENYREKHP